jgi:hypothetical protein
MINGFEIEPGIIISKLDLKENDVILITIDIDKYDLEEAYNIFEMIVKAFPDNKVVATFKGIEISKLKEKEI